MAEVVQETRCGRVTIASDDPAALTQRAGFAAGRTNPVVTLPAGDLEAMHGLRARSLVIATPDGLDIGRGPFGGDPIYYAWDGPDLIVSSRLAPLVDALGERPALDVDALGAHGLARVSLDPRATIYRGVRRLLSCETVRFAADGTMRSSFRLPAVPEVMQRDPRDTAREMRDVLGSIVADVLRRFSAVAVMTGGGLDSGGLLALVAREAAVRGGRRVTALTADFGGPGDDRPHLAALLQHLHAETLRMAPRDVGPIPVGFFRQDAAPYASPSALVTLCLQRRAKAWGADVVVTGASGDFILDGDLGSFAERVGSGELGALIDVARLKVPWRSSPGSRLVDLVARPLLRPWVPASWRHRRRHRWLAAQEVSRWAGPRLRALLPRFTTEVRGGDDWLTAFATSQMATEGADGDGQEEVASGLPRLNIYEDPRFLDLIASIPPEQLFLGGQLRGLFRASMAGLLPDSVRMRRDKASAEPLFEQMFAAAGGFEGLGGLLTMEATADLGLVEPRLFRDTFERLVRGASMSRGWLEVWPMLAVEGFVRSLGAPMAARVGEA